MKVFCNLRHLVGGGGREVGKIVEWGKIQTEKHKKPATPFLITKTVRGTKKLCPVLSGKNLQTDIFDLHS